MFLQLSSYRADDQHSAHTFTVQNYIVTQLQSVNTTSVQNNAEYQPSYIPVLPIHQDLLHWTLLNLPALNTLLLYTELQNTEHTAKNTATQAE